LALVGFFGAATLAFLGFFADAPWLLLAFFKCREKPGFGNTPACPGIRGLFRLFFGPNKAGKSPEKPDSEIIADSRCGSRARAAGTMSMIAD
jgi:hypothetical protein